MHELNLISNDGSCTFPFVRGLITGFFFGGLLFHAMRIVSRTGRCKTNAGGKIGQDCVFPFISNGIYFNGCTDVGVHKGNYWCATQVDANGKEIPGHWGYCTYTCPTASLEDIGMCTASFGNVVNQKCIFPFKFQEKEYFGCTDDADDDGHWCATLVDSDNVMLEWGYCSQFCPKETDQTIEQSTSVGNNDQGGCAASRGDIQVSLVAPHRPDDCIARD